MVGQYLRKLRERYKERQLKTKEESVAEKVDQLRDVRREAWQAWDFSNARTLKVLIQQLVEQQMAAEESGQPLTEWRINLKSLPANEFLMTVLKTLEAERELLGIDEAPKKAEPSSVNVNVGVQVNVWDALADVAQGQLEDRVEARLVEALDAKPVAGLKELPADAGGAP